MPRGAAAGVFVLVMTSVLGSARGQTIYNDGGTHTVNGTSGPILLEGSGTTLDLVSPATISGSSGIQSGVAIIGQVGTTINLLGGQVNGGIGAGGSFSASGGVVQGGDTTRMPGVGGTALDLAAPSGFPSASAQISGGTFIGENASFLGGIGFVLTTLGGTTGNSSSISGGTFQGGSGGTTGNGGDGGHFDLNLTALTINGGTFIGGSGFRSGNTNGNGLILNSFGCSESITGGSFSGADSLIFGGYSSSLVISGGTFHNQMGFGLDDVGTSVTFLGTGLNYDSANGIITGTLDDGSVLSTTLQLGSVNPHLVIQVTNNSGEEIEFSAIASGSVPEPSSIVILAIGLLGLAAAKAYRSRGRHGSSKDAGERPQS